MTTAKTSTKAVLVGVVVLSPFGTDDVTLRALNSPRALFGRGRASFRRIGVDFGERGDEARPTCGKVLDDSSTRGRSRGDPPFMTA